MALAGDHQRQRAHPGAALRIRRQQRRRGMGLLEIFDDGERLEQRGAVIPNQRRQRHLRIYAAKLVGAMCIGVEIDEDHLGRQFFQVERDANAKTRLRSPKGEEFHGGLTPLSCPDLIRASIDLQETLARRWITGSSPVMTKVRFSLSPCGRGWTRCEASRTGEGSVSADRNPSSGATRHLLPQGEKGRK